MDLSFEGEQLFLEVGETGVGSGDALGDCVEGVNATQERGREGGGGGG